MVGGMGRRTPPRDLSSDPDARPHSDLADPGAAAVRHITRVLAELLADRVVTLRTATGRGVRGYVLLGGVEPAVAWFALALKANRPRFSWIGS